VKEVEVDSVSIFIKQLLAGVVLPGCVTAAITQHCSPETFTYLLDEINNTQTSTEMTF